MVTVFLFFKQVVETHLQREIIIEEETASLLPNSNFYKIQQLQWVLAC